MQNSSTEFQGIPSEATRKMVRDFEAHLRLSEQESESQDESYEEEEVDYEEQEQEDEEEEEEFSFSLDSFNFSTISADDAFSNGQIKPAPAAFPLFNQALILPEGDDLQSLMSKDRMPKVNRVFIPAGNAETTSSPNHDETISGPYCEWSNNKAAAAAPDTCKKSNSTGFSKIWRFKEFMHRSNSDGRDAFVFLNHHAATTSSSKKEEKPAAVAVEVKKVRKSKKAALSAHEVYLRSKAKDNERRRSYLPYRQDLVGLFTNVNGGGLTRDVHPF